MISRTLLIVLVVIFGIAPNWDVIFLCLGIIVFYGFCQLIYEIYFFNPQPNVRKPINIAKEAKKIEKEKLEEAKAKMNLEFHKLKIKTFVEKTTVVKKSNK